MSRILHPAVVMITAYKPLGGSIQAAGCESDYSSCNLSGSDENFEVKVMSDITHLLICCFLKADDKTCLRHLTKYI